MCVFRFSKVQKNQNFNHTITIFTIPDSTWRKFHSTTLLFACNWNYHAQLTTLCSTQNWINSYLVKSTPTPAIRTAKKTALICNTNYDQLLLMSKNNQTSQNELNTYLSTRLIARTEDGFYPQVAWPKYYSVSTPYPEVTQTANVELHSQKTKLRIVVLLLMLSSGGCHTPLWQENWTVPTCLVQAEIPSVFFSSALICKRTHHSTTFNQNMFTRKKLKYNLSDPGSELLTHSNSQQVEGTNLQVLSCHLQAAV